MKDTDFTLPKEIIDKLEKNKWYFVIGNYNAFESPEIKWSVTAWVKRNDKK